MTVQVSRGPYWIAFMLLIVSFITCVIAFGTGYWFEAEGEGRLFQRLGLWEACFDGYEHTSDYIGKAYHGCWWIFHKEYSYIRDWILPPWFVAIQTLMTFGLCLQMIALAVFPGAGADNDSIRKEKTATIITLLAFLCVGISVVIFGTMIGEDRTWMPQPDNDVPGWSFGLAVVTGFLLAFSTISMATYTVMRRWQLTRNVDYYGGGMKKGGGSIPMVPKV